MWKVNTNRRGWGWDVIPPEMGSPLRNGAYDLGITPVGSTSHAQAYCDYRNKGLSHAIAYAKIREQGALHK